jgi:hypothetical protein
LSGETVARADNAGRRNGLSLRNHRCQGTPRTVPAQCPLLLLFPCHSRPGNFCRGCPRPFCLPSLTTPPFFVSLLLSVVRVPQLAGEDRMLERRLTRARRKEAAGVIAKWLGRRLRHGNAPRGCSSQIASPRSISTKLPLSRSSECTHNRIRLNLSTPSILCS